jgi:hypothetical protein
MRWSLLDFVVLALRASGALLICAGLFLYEDEEGQFQNKVEQWWINLSDIQRASRSNVAAFMQEVARLTGKGFDQLFGQSLFSLRVVPVSIYLSLASPCLFLFIMLPHVKHDPSVTRQGTLSTFAFFLALALVPALFRNKWVIAIWWAIIPTTILSWSGIFIFLFRTRGPRSVFYGIGLITLAFERHPCLREIRNRSKRFLQFYRARRPQGHRNMCSQIRFDHPASATAHPYS